MKLKLVAHQYFSNLILQSYPYLLNKLTGYTKRKKQLYFFQLQLMF